MTNRLRISLVIPAYNEESHLAECLQAALDQTIPFYEIIVVDNNSSDDTAQIVAFYPGVRLIKEPKQGIVFARNRGFSAARGDIIARIDADSALPATWAEHITAYYADPAHITHAWTSGAEFYNVRFPSLVSGTYNLLAFRTNQLLVGHPTLWGSSMAITKQQWRAVRDHVCFSTAIHEDLDLAIHLHELRYVITYDTSIKATAQLRRVRSNRDELWDYLQWWPRTLRIHGKKSWVLCWLIGVMPLYCVTPLLTLGEHAARLVGYKPMQDEA